MHTNVFAMKVLNLIVEKFLCVQFNTNLFHNASCFSFSRNKK